MSEKERMAREIQDFVEGNMEWECALDLIIRVAQSEEWIDYLLMEIKSLESTAVLTQ